MLATAEDDAGQTSQTAAMGSERQGQDHDGQSVACGAWQAADRSERKIL